MKPTPQMIVQFGMAEVLKFSEQSEEVPIGVRPRQDIEQPAAPASPKIRPFIRRRAVSRLKGLAGTLFGLLSLICLLAFLVNVPILQIAVLGYFLDSSARIARGGKLSTGFIGLKTASKIGRWVLCTALVLIPLIVVGRFWINAQIIDATSQQTAMLSNLYFALAVVTTLHILSTLSCGGEICHFFWPLVAPFSVLARICKGVVGLVRATLEKPKPTMPLAQDKLPSKDWFVPRIIWRKLRQGTLYTQSRDDTLEFLSRLQLPHFAWLGLKGFAGSAIWLLLPTVLLAGANHPRTGLAGLSVLLGVLIAVPAFMILPMLQTQFAVDGGFGSLFDVRGAWSKIRRAPVACLLAMFLMLVLASPLFLLKIEKIPPELFWLLSVLFVVLGWPARFAWGAVYRYAQPRQARASRGIRWPVGIFTATIALVFTFAFFLTRYTSWNGTLSLFENHVFLLPMPFWR